MELWQIFEAMLKFSAILFVVVLCVLGAVECTNVSRAKSSMQTSEQWFKNAKAGLYDNERYTVKEIKISILRAMKDEQRTEVVQNPEYLDVVANSFHKYGNHFEIPQLLMSAIGFKESRYRTYLNGDGGVSMGIMQVGHMGRSKCRRYCGEFSSDPDVQICHGACWLDMGRDDCGSMFGGLSGYVCGKCHPKLSRKPANSHRSMNRRYKLWGLMHRFVKRYPDWSENINLASRE